MAYETIATVDGIEVQAPVRRPSPPPPRRPILIVVTTGEVVS